MDSEKLNALCDEARLRARDIAAKLAIAQNSKTDAGKLRKLMFVMKDIQKIEKTKEQIENEISITKEDTIKELECVRDYNFDTANCIGESLRRAILGKSNAETIKYINDAIYDLCHLERHKIRLETLRERLNLEEHRIGLGILREKLNLEEKENDNQ